MPAASARRRDLVVVLAAMAAFTASTTYLNWVKYVSLQSTFPLDLASFNNAMANAAAGRDRYYIATTCWFSPGDQDGPSVFRSAHFTPLRLWLLPQVYRFRPSVTTLMALQSAFLASGALALHAFAGRRTGARWPGLVLAAAYLMHPLVLHMGFNDFREIQLGVGPALFALAAHADARWSAFAASALLMLSARTEYAFLLALFPVLNWRLAAPERRRIAWFAVPLAVAAGWYVLSAAYYFHFYGVAFPHLTRNAAIAGGWLTSFLGRVPRLLTLLQLPGLLALLTPEALAVMPPFIGAARGVRPQSFPHHHLQHLSPLVVVAFWGFASALVRLAPPFARTRRRRIALVAVVLAATLASFAHFAWRVSQAYLVGGFARFKKLTDLDARLPREATVLVPIDLIARFSGHLRALTYDALPTEKPGTAGVATMAGLVAASDMVATMGEPWLDRLVDESGRFDGPVRVLSYRLFVARPDTPRPADPDRALEAALGWRDLDRYRGRGLASRGPD